MLKITKAWLSMWATFIAPLQYMVVDKHIFEVKFINNVDFNNSDEKAH